MMNKETKDTNNRCKWGRRLGKALIWIFAAWMILLVAAEITISSRIATDIVNRYAAEYVDGSLSFGKVSVSMFRNFPNASIRLEDFSVTYPSDRFARQKASSPQNNLLYSGSGENQDTLASFSSFTASIGIMPLVFGKISVPTIELIGPRIFAHKYSDAANWNITRSDSTATADTSSASKELPTIEIGRIRLKNHPHIVYTSSSDTVFAMIDLKQAGFNGRLTTSGHARNKVGLALDSMFVAGWVASDTVALGLDRLRILEQNGSINFNVSAKATAATQSFGRIHVPLDLSGTARFPKDTVPSLNIKDFKAAIAGIPLEGEADLRFHKEKTAIDGNLSVTGCKAGDMLEKYVRVFIPDVRNIKTDAVINMDLKCHGEYISGSRILPECEISLSIPKTSLSHRDFPEKIVLELAAGASSDGKGKINASVNGIQIKTAGLDIDAKAGASDILSEDPLLDIDMAVKADVGRLTDFLPDKDNLESAGSISAEIKGNAALSHLSIYTFSDADLHGKILSDSLLYRSPSDSIDISVSGMEINLGPENIASRIDSSRLFRLIGISAAIDRAAIAYRNLGQINGKDLFISAKNSVDTERTDTAAIRRLGGRLNAKSLSFTDASGSDIRLAETKNSFQMMPKRSNPRVPVLSLTSSNKRIALVTDINRGILTDASIKARAEMTSVDRRRLRRERLDSLQKIYPDTPRDSLLRKAMRSRQSSRDIPEWMKEEDFRKQDISITLDQSLAKYFREWDLNGSIGIRTGILMTPYLPLRNILRGCDISFTNDRIAIDSLKVISGESEISAKGDLSGLRRTLTGRGTLKLGLDITSGKVNANELLAAISAGSGFNPENAAEGMSDASDAEFLKMVTSDTLNADDRQKLIVIPANLNADITLNAGDIVYSDLHISGLKSTLTMKERCIQITNSLASSNIGEVSFEGFYATRTKKDIRAGFNFGFKDITAEKAIDLFPAVDTLMPLLKSFAGKMNCELAATASLDTNMTVLTPTINGVVRISGNDLSISGSDTFTSLAKKLKFNNRETGHIRQMTVEGVIKDNVLEVFPFVISMDRYTLALSGKQNLDKSYRYHASIIRSPLVIKVGVDIYGKDFDNMKFKIGKAKYKNEKVPVFTAVIDQTRINLAESIRNIYEKGVEAAIRENEQQNAINDLKSEIGYVNAVDQNLEELSEEEKVSIEGDSAGLQAVPSDTTEVKINNQQDEQSGIH